MTKIAPVKEKTQQPVRGGATSSNKKRMPNLSNMTPGALADEIGDIRIRMKKLKAYEKYFGEGLKARLKKDKKTEAQGEKHIIELEHVSQERIDSAAVRTLLTPAQLKTVCKTIEYDQLRLKSGGDEGEDELSYERD